jgi:hypothetical protein
MNVAHHNAWPFEVSVFPARTGDIGTSTSTRKNEIAIFGRPPKELGISDVNGSDVLITPRQAKSHAATTSEVFIGERTQTIFSGSFSPGRHVGELRWHNSLMRGWDSE